MRNENGEVGLSAGVDGERPGAASHVAGAGHGVAGVVAKAVAGAEVGAADLDADRRLLPVTCTD